MRNVLPVLFVLLAAMVRFYGLDGPAMWWDEILVPMTAQYSWDYIFDFSMHSEMHPPYFTGLIKIVEKVSSSEFALRIMSAIAGTMTVGVVYAAGSRVAGVGCGLIAASLLIANPYMVWLSRQVRPYALLLLALSFVLYYSSKYNEKGSWWKIGLASLVQLLLHYVSLFIVLAQSVALFSCAFVEKSVRRSLLGIAAYCVSVVVGVLMVIPFFISLMSQRASSFQNVSKSYGDVFAVLKSMFVKLSHMIYARSDYHPELFFIVLGGIVLLAKRCSVGLVAVFIAVLPMAMLLVNKNSYIYYWHVSYLVPVFALLFSCGLCWVVRNRTLQVVASLAIAIVSLSFVWSDGVVRYYSEDSHSFFAIGGYSKLARPAARELLSIPASAEMPTVYYTESIGFFNALSWYLDRYTLRNPLKDQLIESGNTKRNVVYVSNNTERGGLTPAAYASSYSSLNLLELRNILEYHPFHVVTGREGFATSSVSPMDFYRWASWLRDVTVVDNMGPAVVPTRVGHQGSFGFEVLNESQYGHSIFFELNRTNRGKGNVLTIHSSFDGQPGQTIYHEEGVQQGQGVRIRLDSPPRYERLDVTVDLMTADITADYEGGNQTTMKLQDVAVVLAPPGLMFDLLTPSTLPAGVVFKGIRGVERDGNGAWRWVDGPRASFELDAAEDLDGKFKLGMSNPIVGQDVVVYLNGEMIGKKNDIPGTGWLQDPISMEMPAKIKKGRNRLEFHFGRWNHKDPDSTFAPVDANPLAIALTSLSFWKAEADRSFTHSEATLLNVGRPL